MNGRSLVSWTCKGRRRMKTSAENRTCSVDAGPTRTERCRRPRRPISVGAAHAGAFSPRRTHSNECSCFYFQIITPSSVNRLFVWPSCASLFGSLARASITDCKHATVLTYGPGLLQRINTVRFCFYKYNRVNGLVWRACFMLDGRPWNELLLTGMSRREGHRTRGKERRREREREIEVKASSGADCPRLSLRT